jgi:parallel beta-helix repeat protein
MDGIYLEGTSTNTRITNNMISNSGVIKGIANNGSLTCGIYATYQPDILIQYNTITNSGYNGIFQGHTIGAEIRNNLITYSCLVLDDGGGYYTGNNLGGSTEGTDGTVIDGNIILYTIGNYDGTTRSVPYAYGIYLDNYANDITVSNNTVAYSGDAGIQLHAARHNIITGNTGYDAPKIYWNYNDVGNGVSHSNTITYNKFIAKATQDALYYYSSWSDCATFGTADNNYYTRPVDDDDDIRVRCTGDTHYTLAQWQAYSSQDANSHKSVYTVEADADIHLAYNGTNVNKTYVLSATMYDVVGVAYSAGYVVITPYTSKVFLGVGTVTEL